MPSSAADRKRAQRMRDRGGPRDDAERAWLDAYTSRSTPAPAPAPTPAPAPAPAPTPTPTPAPAPEPAPRVIDFGEPQSPSPSPSQSPSPSPSSSDLAIACNCAACKRRAAGGGATTCRVTGETVYPALSMDGARGMAQGVLGIMAIGAKMMYGRDVKAEKHEIDSLARSLILMAERRSAVGWMGQWDDLFAIGFVLVSFMARAARPPQVAA